MANPGSIWSVGTGYKIQTVIERTQVNLALPLVSSFTDVTTELISGTLPSGTRLRNNYIEGTAFEVVRDTSFKFTIRAYSGAIFEDRTFEIVVSGPDSPEWITTAGMLPVGEGNLLFVLDNAIIDYQLLANDTDLPAGDEINYFIAEGDGELPPGISLSEDGRLTGVCEALLSLEKGVEENGYDGSPYGGLPLDWAAVSSNGYSSFYYDSFNFDYSIDTNQPKKLNRYYSFRVTVTDGDSFVKREFTIYLVGDDYLKADNTLMQSSNGVFTADNTNVRTPVWLTPSDLGFRRADNFVMLPVEVINSTQLEGVIRYTLEDINDDNTKSKLPNGLTLDYITGTISGYLPYQPSVVKDYKFTVRATRLTFDLETVEIFGTYYEDVMLGKSQFKIYKTDLTGNIDGVNDVLELRNKKILLGDSLYTVVNVDNSNKDYEVIFVDQTLAPEISLLLSQTALAGQDYFFANRLDLKSKEKYTGRNLNFSASESYKINSIVPYIDYDVVQITPSNDPIFPYASPSDITIGTSYFVGDYVVYTDTVGGNNFVYKALTAHTTSAQLNDSNNFILDADGNLQINFINENWTQVAETLDTLPLADRLEATRQAIVRSYGGPVYITVKSDTIWNVKLPSTSLTRIKQNISQFFKGQDSSDFRIDLIRDNEDRVQLDINLSTQLNQGRNIGIALFAKDSFSKNIVTSARDEVDIPSSKKTFTLKTVGEIESNIKWITPANLGTIEANLPSTKSIQAQSTVPDTKMVYVVTSGKLPNGMRLTYDGEIIGIPKQYATKTGLGLTTFEGGKVTWDGFSPGVTTFDREYKFTVQTRDRFNYAALTREFTLTVLDTDSVQYSQVHMKPMLTKAERTYLQNFTSNPDIFQPNKLYRPQDSEFGIQKDLKLLVYSGIEALDVKEFVAAAAKNHKRKTYNLGALKSAIAKVPGTNEVIYEVIYIPVLDPAKPIKGRTANQFRIANTNSITVDSMQYNISEDSMRTNAGYDTLPIYGRETVKFVQVNNEEIVINLRATGDIPILADEQDFEIIIQNDQTATVTLQVTDAEPYKRAPEPINTIKVDSDAVIVSQNKDEVRYISNLDNIRTNISKIGKTKRSYLPLWMRTPQQGLQELDYIPAIPLCYCKPGFSADIIRNLNNASFDAKKINYDIDRYIVSNTKDKESETFILFANYKFNV